MQAHKSKLWKCNRHFITSFSLLHTHTHTHSHTHTHTLYTHTHTNKPILVRIVQNLQLFLTASLLKAALSFKNQFKDPIQESFRTLET